MSLFKNLIGKLSGRRSPDEAAEVPIADWKVLHVKNDELAQDLIVRIRTARPVLPKGARYDTAFLIEWAYTEDVRSLPSQETFDLMAEFERTIDPLTAENGFAELLLVRTGLGQRNWLFYTRDQDRFMTEFNRLLSGQPPYPLAINFGADPDWSMWQETLADFSL